MQCRATDRIMIKLLEQAVAEIEKLPEDAQDAIAARLLADLADEKAWAARFAATTLHGPDHQLNQRPALAVPFLSAI